MSRGRYHILTLFHPSGPQLAISILSNSYVDLSQFFERIDQAIAARDAPARDWLTTEFERAWSDGHRAFWSHEAAARVALFSSERDRASAIRSVAHRAPLLSPSELSRIARYVRTVEEELEMANRAAEGDANAYDAYPADSPGGRPTRDSVAQALGFGRLEED